MPAVTVSQIAALCGGEVIGDGGRAITAANTIEDAGPGDVSFVANDKAAAAADKSKAGCLIVSPGLRPDNDCALVVADNPRFAFTRVLHELYPPPTGSTKRHPTAVIASSAIIGENVSIGAFAVVSDHSTIGDGCHVGHHVTVGESVVVGPGTLLHPHVVLYPGVQVGARCVLHSGCVIGADGFGFALNNGRYQKFPQVGTVRLGDDVEIGANTCIDRAALGITSIGEGTKLDNLVHIAHNCKVGAHVVIAAQTGFSGGVTVGNYAVIGGQVGVGDHASIAARAVVGSQAGILPSKHVPAGEPVWGTPARPLRQHLKGLAHLARLSNYRQELQSLKRAGGRASNSEKV